MTRRVPSPPLPPKRAMPSTLTVRTSHSTARTGSVEKISKPPPRAQSPARPPKSAPAPSRRVARIVDDEESSLLDLVDNLLAKGVMLNADLVLALANVDLVYIRLSALLCAADRILPVRRAPKPRSGVTGPVPPKPRSGEGG